MRIEMRHGGHLHHSRYGFEHLCCPTLVQKWTASQERKTDEHRQAGQLYGCDLNCLVVALWACRFVLTRMLWVKNI